MKEPSEQVKDGISSAGTGSDLQDEEVEKMSSVLPTMWIGAQSGRYIVQSYEDNVCFVCKFFQH